MNLAGGSSDHEEEDDPERDTPILDDDCVLGAGAAPGEQVHPTTSMPPPSQWNVPMSTLPIASSSPPHRESSPLPDSSQPPNGDPFTSNGLLIPLPEPRSSPTPSRWRLPEQRRVPLPRVAELQRDPDASGEGRVLCENSDTASPASQRVAPSQSQSQSQGDSAPQSSQQLSTLRNEVALGPSTSARVSTEKADPIPGRKDEESQEDSQGSAKTQQSLSYQGDSQPEGQAPKSQPPLPREDHSQDQEMLPASEVPALPQSQREHSGEQEHPPIMIDDEASTSGSPKPGDARSTIAPKHEPESPAMLANGPSWAAIRTSNTPADEDEEDDDQVDELLSSTSNPEQKQETARRRERKAKALVKVTVKAKPKPKMLPQSLEEPSQEMSPDDQRIFNTLSAYILARHANDGSTEARATSPVKGSRTLPGHVDESQAPPHDPSVWDAPTFMKKTLSKASSGQGGAPTDIEETPRKTTSRKRSERTSFTLSGAPPVKKPKTIQPSAPSSGSIDAAPRGTARPNPEKRDSTRSLKASAKVKPITEHIPPPVAAVIPSPQSSSSSIQSAATSSTKVTQPLRSSMQPSSSTERLKFIGSRPASPPISPSSSHTSHRTRQDSAQPLPPLQPPPAAKRKNETKSRPAKPAKLEPTRTSKKKNPAMFLALAGAKTVTAHGKSKAVPSASKPAPDPEPSRPPADQEMEVDEPDEHKNAKAEAEAERRRLKGELRETLRVKKTSEGPPLLNWNDLKTILFETGRDRHRTGNPS